MGAGTPVIILQFSENGNEESHVTFHFYFLTARNGYIADISNANPRRLHPSSLQ